jgi:hypothetical protein
MRFMSRTSAAFTFSVSMAAEHLKNKPIVHRSETPGHGSSILLVGVLLAEF